MDDQEDYGEARHYCPSSSLSLEGFITSTCDLSPPDQIPVKSFSTMSWQTALSIIAVTGRACGVWYGRRQAHYAQKQTQLMEQDIQRRLAEKEDQSHLVTQVWTRREGTRSFRSLSIPEQSSKKSLPDLLISGCPAALFEPTLPDEQTKQTAIREKQKASAWNPHQLDGKSDA